MSRAVARRGLALGCASHAFRAADLLAALRRARLSPATVYVDVDGAGLLCAGAGARGGAGGAEVCARARLAEHVLARTAALELAPPGALRVRTTRALAPHDELLLWPDAALLAAARVPHLEPTHILGVGGYACGACGASFEHPNPLKVHVYLSCAPPAPPAAAARAFLRRLLAALPTPPPAQAPHTPAPPRSAFRPVPPSLSPSPAPPLAAPALEALAAAWGRAAAGGAGHLCLYCGKLYSRKYGLKIHIRTHTGYKPLRCRHCARAFGDPSNLNKHVRLHASTSPAAPASPVARHSCPQCGAAMARRRDLERHVRARHAARDAAPPDARSASCPLLKKDKVPS